MNKIKVKICENNVKLVFSSLILIKTFNIRDASLSGNFAQKVVYNSIGRIKFWAGFTGWFQDC